MERKVQPRSLHYMRQAGSRLATLFQELAPRVVAGVTTGALDDVVASLLSERGMRSQSKGYRGYAHVSCISVNDEVVHGVPRHDRYLCAGDCVTVDVCAAYDGWCVDMARTFFVGDVSSQAQHLVAVAQQALDGALSHVRPSAYVSDISHAVQSEVERHGYGIVRDFCGHGIGRSMHLAPEVPNYGSPGKGCILRSGMALAIEPMITQGDYRIAIDSDGWTARTRDGSLAAHVEDTVVITDEGPIIVTRS